MGRPKKCAAAMDAICGFGPIREYWQQMNRETCADEKQLRAKRKASDKKRRKCTCKAYPWPHRPSGGLCRWPDPPIECYVRKKKSRPYSTRYQGIRRQIMRANGFHPIRHRAALDEIMSFIIALAKEHKLRYPDQRYREIEVTETGIRGHRPGSRREWRR